MTTKKDDFIFTMEALKQQMDYDKVWSETMTTTLGADVIPIYNNGILVNTLISEMCSWFPDAEEAKREISRYIYELDFGRLKGLWAVNAEQLWDDLNLPKVEVERPETRDDMEKPKLGYNYLQGEGWLKVMKDLYKEAGYRDDMEAKNDESDFQEIENILREFREWDRSWNAKGPRPDRPISFVDFAKQLSKKYEVKKKK